MTAMNWDYRYAGRMSLYFLKKCNSNTVANVTVAQKVEKSHITVGDGYIDSFLNSLSHELDVEEVGTELALA